MPRPRRTNRVAEQTAVFVAYAAGACAAFAPPSPTGHRLIDAALLAVGTWLVAYAAASAPWWLLAVAGGVAAATVVDVLPVVVAVAGWALALYVGVRRRNLPELRSLSAGLTFNALAWSGIGGPFGTSAAIGLTLAVLVVVLGVRRRPRVIRRRVGAALAITGVVAALGVAGLALGASSARGDLSRGRQLAEQGISAINGGDFALAAERFDAASVALGRASDRLHQPWVAASAVVPVVAQHGTAARELAASGATATGVAATALREIDPDALRLTAGQMDLDAVAALGEPFREVQAALREVSVSLATADSPWLIGPVADQVDSLRAKVDDNAPRLDNAVAAVDLAPAMMGGDGPRRYLVLFTTPAEARGLGGFPGNYAELTFDDGRVAVTGLGRVSDLELVDQERGTRLDEPVAFLDRYGAYVTRPDGTANQAAWRNLTIAPHFPWVAEAAASLYEQETDVAVDGVMVLDVFVVAQLLAYTGPIDLPDVGVQLTADNAIDYLLVGQYQLTDDRNAERIDALEAASQLTIERLLAGTLPGPTQLARDLGPLAAERRLLVWTKDEREQSMLRGVGLLGEVPAPYGADGWSLALTNGGGNKIDSFLTRRARYVTDTTDGVTTATLTIELTNDAPAAGLPAYVIGNAVGLPTGTSRLLTTVYSPLAITGATIDGQPWTLSQGEELGWNTFAGSVDIPPGATVTLVVEFRGVLADPDQLVTWVQPMAHPLAELGG